MGDAYKGNIGGTSLTGAYGLWWSYPSAGGPASNLSSHGLMCIVNGVFYASLDASMRAISDMRTPIFYDLNNTGYYLNPDGSSYLHTLVLSGANYFRPQNWIQFDGTYGLYWPSSYGAHLSANDLSTYTQIALRGVKNSYGGIYDNHSGVNGIMYDSGGNGGVYREANGRWFWYYNVSNNCMGIGTSSTSSAYNIYAPTGLYSGGRVDGTVFYDSNDTAYYLDPNTTSNSALRIRGGALHGPNPTWGKYLYVGTDGAHIGGISTVGVTDGNLHIDCESGYILYLNYYSGRPTICGGDVRASVFYDQSNTAYFGDFASTGDSIRAAGNIVAYYSDERLKKHLGKIENALDKLQQLEGFYYEANEVAQKLGYKVKREVGVSAQAVQRVLPEIVTDAPISAQYLTIDYERLVPLLVEAIKELKSELDEVKLRIH
jgi:hypothetical protein